MNKRYFVISGVLLVSILIISLVVINARKPKDGVLEISQCNEDASELCVVTFGLDDQDNMVINFQLPKADYPLFYVKASNRGSVNTYSCEVVTAEPTSVFCRGMRTPLGEYIDMEVYAVGCSNWNSNRYCLPHPVIDSIAGHSLSQPNHSHTGHSLS